MNAHPVDRFVAALKEADEWHTDRPIRPGVFRCSPEVARMWAWHLSRFPRLSPPGHIFSCPVIPDPTMPRGRTVFVRDAA